MDAEALRGLQAGIVRREDEVVALLERLTVLESPSGDEAALGRCAAALAALFGDLGCVVRDEPCDTGRHLVAELGEGRAPCPLVLCHYDTVWPVGTVAGWPFGVEGGAATGPGVLDMKGGIVAVHTALSALRAAGQAPAVRVSLTPDEEIGNPGSGAAVARLAAEASAALVMEPPLPGGALKTARKGIAKVRLEIEGRSAHAGLDPERGVSAALEAAHVALAAERLADPDDGTTVNVGILRAGERSNVVAGEGTVVLEVRGWREQAIEGVIGALRSRPPSIAGARIRVDGHMHRPPMVRAAETEALLARARAVAGPLGLLPLEEGQAGGASEGNLAAHAGTPTLDGLGPEGEWAHSRDERVLVRSILERSALLAGLLAVLDGEGGG